MSQNFTERKRPDYSGLIIIGVSLLPVLFLFNYMVKQNMRLTLLIVLPAIITTIKIYWDSIKHIWFWAVIVLMLRLHVPVVSIVRWPQHWVSPLSLMPIALADFLIVAGAVHLGEKFIVKPLVQKVGRRPLLSKLSGTGRKSEHNTMM